MDPVPLSVILADKKWKEQLTDPFRKDAPAPKERLCSPGFNTALALA